MYLHKYICTKTIASIVTLINCYCSENTIQGRSGMAAAIKEDDSSN